MSILPVLTLKNSRPLLKRVALASIAAIALSPVLGQALLQNSYPHLPPEMNRVPDRNQINDINASQAKKPSFETANAERKKQMIEDSSRLLKAAADLKTELDKTDRDMLSLSVIRKAEEIEKLAHSLKEKMKLTVGPG